MKRNAKKVKKGKTKDEMYIVSECCYDPCCYDLCCEDACC